MSPYLLGIDSGLTVTKAVLFDEDGYERGAGSVANEHSSPRPRWLEQDMEVLWGNCQKAIRAALDAVNIKGEEVGAIGVSGHGDGVYLVDENGSPVRPGVLSMDSRSHEVLARWEGEGLGDEVLKLTGQRPFVSFSPVVLAWFEENEPEVLQKTRYLLYVKDWIRYKLTGEYATDFSEASSGFTDVRTQEYTGEVFSLYGLEEMREKLPPVAGCAETVGGVTGEAAEATGLCAGTPVVGGAHDLDCSAVGVGSLQPGDLTIVAGTWSINTLVHDGPTFNEGVSCRNFVRPGLWLNLAASPTSATNLEWFVRNMCPLEVRSSEELGVSPFAFVNDEVESVMNEDSRVFYHPFLYGSPHGDDATAGFFGLRGWHTRAHVLRALLEGTVFNHKTHVEDLRGAFEVKKIRLTGGGSSSRVWSQMFADALGETVEVTGAEETGALGAALCAGVGVGVYGSLEEGAGSVVRTFRTHEPDPRNGERLATAYETYMGLIGAMGPLWPRTG